MATLVLLRHGESEWNKANLFTGWHDVELTELGVEEARQGGALLAAEGLLPTVVHTSLQRRAIRTAELALGEIGRSWVPVRRHWRLNERHYGDLQGRNKAESTERWGEAQVKAWRRGYDTPPPPLPAGDERHPRNDPRYADVAPDQLPSSECLKDVVVRLLPYWHDAVVPDLRAGHLVCVSAHGNSLRALVKHLEHIPDDVIAGVNIPTGVPLVYLLDDDDPCRVLDSPGGGIGGVRGRYLGDDVAVRAKIEGVANQASARTA